MASFFMHGKQPVSAFVGWWMLALICVASFSIMLMASLGDSGTTDELAHIPAGYGYVRYLDYRLNPEHPPLVKTLSALPLLFLNLNFPDGHTAWETEVNGQWEMGNEFLYRSGNDANRIIRWSRFFPMLLTILLIILIYAWSRTLMRPLWGLVPAFLFAFSPSTLAHGHYVTTDIGAALGIMGGTYYFLSALKNPSKKNLWCAGIAFGIAQLLKFSAVLLIPFFFFLAFAYAWRSSAGKQFLRAMFRSLRNTVLIFLIGYAAIVYPVYGILTVNYPVAKQLSDTQFILGSFAGGAPQEGTTCSPMRCIAELDIRMAGNRIMRPIAQYLLGVLMVIQRSGGGNTAYFMGQVSAAGSHLYFPIVYALKETLPTLIIIVGALLFGLWNIGKETLKNIRRISSALREYLTLHLDTFAMISFVILYWAYSIQSPLNIGFRHLFPAIPFMYILSASAWKRWITSMNPVMANSETGKEKVAGFLAQVAAWLRKAMQISLRANFLFFLLLWFTLETAFAAPYFLSYFNEIGGGTNFGYRYVTDSNYDWGQDLLRLQKFIATKNKDSNPENDIEKIAVDYFGAGNPNYYFMEKAEPWWSVRGNPSTSSGQAHSTGSGQAPSIGWFAVSINSLQSALQPTAPGFERKAEDEYEWLRKLRPPSPGIGNVPVPDFRAGTSIFVYDLREKR